MSQHPAPEASADENLLREIALKEQELQQQVAEVQAEAARLIDQAQQQAEAIRTATRDQAQQVTAAAAAASQQEANKITRETLARAETEVQRIRRQAEDHRRLAVDAVTSEVLGLREERTESA